MGESRRVRRGCREVAHGGMVAWEWVNVHGKCWVRVGELESRVKREKEKVKVGK